MTSRIEKTNGPHHDSAMADHRSHHWAPTPLAASRPPHPQPQRNPIAPYETFEKSPLTTTTRRHDLKNSIKTVLFNVVSSCRRGFSKVSYSPGFSRDQFPKSQNTPSSPPQFSPLLFQNTPLQNTQSPNPPSITPYPFSMDTYICKYCLATSRQMRPSCTQLPKSRFDLLRKADQR